MSIFHYALGLDIGTESVGWAILQNNAEGEPIRIQDLGVRVFDKAELPKTGKSLAVSRREAPAHGAGCAAIAIVSNASAIYWSDTAS